MSLKRVITRFYSSIVFTDGMSCGSCDVTCDYVDTAMQNKNTVTPYLLGMQLVSFGFTR